MQSKGNKPAPAGTAKHGSGKSGAGELNANPPELIEITYAADGMPEADRCEVTAASGTEIVWRGPVDDDTPFSILFDEDPSVAEQEDGLVVESSFIDQRHTASLILKPVEALCAFRYLMLANGHRSDPIIVVNPIMVSERTRNPDEDPDDDD